MRAAVRGGGAEGHTGFQKALLFMHYALWTVYASLLYILPGRRTLLPHIVLNLISFYPAPYTIFITRGQTRDGGLGPARRRAGRGACRSRLLKSLHNHKHNNAPRPRGSAAPATVDS